MKGVIFTFAMTYGGAIVGLFSPFYGLLIYACFAVMKPESLWHWALPPGNYSRTLAIAFLIGWTLHGFGDWNFGRAKPIVWALIGFWIWMILSAAAAPYSALAWKFVESHSKILLPVLVGMTLIDSLAKLRQLAWVIVMAQAYLAFELNLSYVTGVNRGIMNSLIGLDSNGISVAMVTGVGLAFFLGLGEAVWWKRWSAFAAAGLMAHVPMFVMSRGGMLGLCVVGAVAFFLIPKKPKHFVLFALAAVIALRLAGPEVLDRFSMVFASAEERDASAAGRIEYWGFCWEFMNEQPALGVGPGAFRYVATERHPEAIASGYNMVQFAHSLWFETGAEMGFPGVGFLLAFYLLPVWLLWRLLRAREAIPPFYTDVARMVISSLAGFGVSASFVSISAVEVPYFVVLLGAGVMRLVSEPGWQTENPVREPSGSPWQMAGTVKGTT